MSLGKLLTLGIIGMLAWQHQEQIEPYLDDLGSAVPTMRTFMEMRSYEPLVQEYMQDNRRPPRDFGALLEEHYPPKGDRPASLDLFGSPYVLERAREHGLVIRSCGPDGACHTEDDLIVPVEEAR